MGRFARVSGFVVDAALGLPTRSVAYTIERNVAVHMPDGVALLADHYRPAEVEGPLPVVLIRVPYGRGGAYGQMFAAPLARRGFQVFTQATRGTFGSGGQFRPFTTERTDGLATLKWLRDQSWCDGRVAMVGGSYFGHTQWAVAPYADPPLTCVSPHITSSQVTSTLFYNHGVPQIHTALSWSASIGSQERGGLPAVRRRAKVDRALRKLPLQAADVDVAGAPVPFWRDFTEHAPPRDDFWSEANHDQADFTRMPPVTMVTGWWDLFAAGQLADYTALRAAGVPARLVVGPWLHGEPGELRTIAQTDATWLDHHLRGGPAPSGPPVRVHLQQAKKWLTFENWPPPQAKPQAWHLLAGGGLGPVTGSGGSSGFTYDPSDPTPTVGGPLLQPPGKQADNAEIESRADVLVFTSEPLPAHLDIVGPVSARVHVTTSRPDADLFVRLCDVNESGVSRNIVDGIVRLTNTHAGAGAEADVNLFPTAYRVKAGHRLRVQVSGGAFPRYARNMGTEEPFATATSGLPCDYEIALGFSQVNLSVLAQR
ncbi:CocE/NonD family hydrolase [Actinoplanes sp. TFC3]|uniref:CocE/NonD family hydrolase n=1 Tax=Actinoplanes sp. TFC3 TaxID=1710355 RepID=UPI00083662B6|nr:CocE/NonD family hydrolase [Actinoplanes sp. TFC3]